MSEIKAIPELEEREIKNELDTLRHSTAHVLAHAVKNLYPKTQFGIGPTIEEGFYYDIELDVTLIPEDLLRIEDEMKKIIAQNHSFERQEWEAKDATELFKNLNQSFKLEIIKDLGAAKVSTYTEGDFIDLCRGPHVDKTGRIKIFKLLSIAGAYWRGNPQNKQLQRIYGTAFFTQQELAEYLHIQEEAKKRDHRKLGKELDLFSFDSIAPGGPFFHPKGTVIYNRLIQFMREFYQQYQYQEVITPQILDISLWHRSGHYENYKENMYFIEENEREYAVKPMNCPGNALIYRTHKRSYRELPLRLADFGRIHRLEASGALSGLTRVRSFAQDDAHIFCALDQIETEIQTLIEMIFKIYKIFGFQNTEIFLSTRPVKRVGSDAFWDQAEDALKKALDQSKAPYKINAGDGAFYGPKIDFFVHDALKRPWQLGTIQLDFNMPERFELEYVGADNTAHRPVMIHRAVLGSLERFIGVLIEHYAGAFPFWLAPIQCIVIPIAQDQQNYCKDFHTKLCEKGFRAELDDRSESLNLKTREAQMKKIPYMLVAGQREVSAQTFSVRKYAEKTSQTLPHEELVKLFLDQEDLGKFHA